MSKELEFFLGRLVVGFGSRRVVAVGCLLLCVRFCMSYWWFVQTALYSWIGCWRCGLGRMLGFTPSYGTSFVGRFGYW